MKRLLILFSVILFCATVTTAQNFSGTLDLNRYTVDNSGSENHTGSLTLMVGDERIYLDAVGNLDAIEQLTQTSINHALIRHDHRDIILYGRGDQALQINNEEIEALVNMMDNLQQKVEEGQEQHAELEYNQTGETRNIQGYQAEKWVLQGDDGESYHIWLTDQLTINWGLLADDFIMKMAGAENLPVQRWLQDQKTPLLVERYVNENLTDIMKFENINEGQTDRSKLDTPEGKQLVTVQELMMQRFQQQ